MTLQNEKFHSSESNVTVPFKCLSKQRNGLVYISKLQYDSIPKGQRKPRLLTKQSRQNSLTGVAKFHESCLYPSLKEMPHILQKMHPHKSASQRKSITEKKIERNHNNEAKVFTQFNGNIILWIFCSIQRTICGEMGRILLHLLQMGKFRMRYKRDSRGIKRNLSMRERCLRSGSRRQYRVRESCGRHC